jgi:hypothetical protein
MRGLRVGDVTGVGDAIYDGFCDKTWAAGEEGGEGRTRWSDISQLNRNPRKRGNIWTPICISHSWHRFFTIYSAHAHIAPFSSSTGCLFQRRQRGKDPMKKRRPSHCAVISGQTTVCISHPSSRILPYCCFSVYTHCTNDFVCARKSVL